MWVRGNHKERYTRPSAWHVFKERSTAQRFKRSYFDPETQQSAAEYETWDTVKSIDGYSWFFKESEQQEELPKKGKICGGCLQRYLNENRVPE